MSECYEQLRQDALGQHPTSGLGLGRAVLVRQGVVAWMRSLGSCWTPLTVAARQPAQASFLTVPAAVRGELVQRIGEAVLTMISSAAR